MNVIRFWNVFHETTHLIIDDSFPTNSIWLITSQIFVQRALQLITNNQSPCLKRASKYSILHNTDSQESHKPCLKRASKYSILHNTDSQESRLKWSSNYNIVKKPSFYRLQITLQIQTPLPLFDLMGDFHSAKLLAPYLMAHYGAILIIGKP